MYLEVEPIDSMEILKHLGEQETKNFLAFEELFGSDGWKLVLHYANQQSINEGFNGANAKSWEDNRVAFGARKTWDHLLNMESVVMSLFADAATTAQAAAEEEAEDVFNPEIQ